MLKRILLTASLLATPAWAQISDGAANGRLVMQVAVSADHSTRVNLGLLRIDETGAAAIVQRREMADRCEWNPAAELPVQLDDVQLVPVPASEPTPEQFGATVTTLYNTTAASKGGTPTAEQSDCVRALMVALAEFARQRDATAAAAAQAPQQ